MNMKRFILLPLLIVVLFSITATAQHYVKVVNNTQSTRGEHYKKGFIFTMEIDSAKAYYIYIEEQSTDETTRKGGVVNGAIFKITQYNTDIKKVHFNDDRPKDRYDAFSKAKIVIKINDSIYVPYDNIDFLDASIVKRKHDSIKTIIKEKCVYDDIKKVLDCTLSPYEYLRKGKKYNSEKIIDVQNNEQITFIIETEDIPDITFYARELVNAKPKDVKSKSNVGNWFKENWLVILIGVVTILFVILLIIVIIKHPNLQKSQKSKKEPKRQEKEKIESIRSTKDPASTKSENPTDVVTQTVVDEKLYQKSKKIEEIVIATDRKAEQIESKTKSIRDALEEQKKMLSDIKALVSNSDEKKQLLEKTRALEKATQELSNAKTEITGLEEQVNDLKKKTDLKGVVQILDCAKFVSFAKNIIDECVNAECQIYQYWNTLTDVDQQKINYFLGKMQLAKTQVNFARWNGLIATLEIDGYVKNGDYIKYLTNLSNKDKLAFLEKRFFEDILRPYVGNVVLFMEQIRTIQKLGVKEVFKGNLEGVINSICTKCFEQGVTIDYRKLYEKVTDYDSLEIEESVPKAIQKAISNIEEEDILLYVDKYAVNLKSGEFIEKTRCVVKI